MGGHKRLILEIGTGIGIEIAIVRLWSGIEIASEAGSESPKSQESSYKNFVANIKNATKV